MKLIVSLIISLFCFSAIAFADNNGNTVGNGGDGYVAEFVLTAQTALSVLKKISSPALGQFNTDQFAGTILNTKIYSEDTLELRGQAVDAINYPELKIIKISRKGWDELRRSIKTVARFNLVLHEYLGIMGIDDSSYQVSQEIIKLITPSNFSTQAWWFPMNPTNLVKASGEGELKSCIGFSFGFKFSLQVESESKQLQIYCQKNSFYLVDVTKTSEIGIMAGGLSGNFHKFDIKVYNPAGKLIATNSYIPEWGRCLIPTEEFCSQSGKVIVGNVALVFGLNSKPQ